MGAENRIDLLWKVLPFPQKLKVVKNKEEITSDKWADFTDFLTNGSDGVFVAIARGDGEGGVANGDILIVDGDLKPEKGDIVIVRDGDNAKVKMYAENDSVIGVITNIMKPLDSHRRQRE